jgi:hypothetical protein
MLHYLDDLDSKMGAMRALYASDKGEAEWTERSGALERRLLRADKYLANEGAAVANVPEQLKLDDVVIAPAEKSAGKKAR